MRNFVILSALAMILMLHQIQLSHGSSIAATNASGKYYISFSRFCRSFGSFSMSPMLIMCPIECRLVFFAVFNIFA